MIEDEALNEGKIYKNDILIEDEVNYFQFYNWNHDSTKVKPYPSQINALSIYTQCLLHVENNELTNSLLKIPPQ